MVEQRFGAEYYQRHYEDPTTRVYDAETIERTGRFVAAYLEHLELEVERVLDLGCGLGFWKPVVERVFPGAVYEGVEVSAYLCERFGWTQGSVVDFEAEPADLVICQGVLQYLDARQAARALKNLASLCHGALFLEVLTRGDWSQNVSQARTDGDVYLRDADWYRRRLAPSFITGGGGLFFHRDSGAVLYELECLP